MKSFFSVSMWLLRLDSQFFKSGRIFEGKSPSCWLEMFINRILLSFFLLSLLFASMQPWNYVNEKDTTAYSERKKLKGMQDRSMKNFCGIHYIRMFPLRQTVKCKSKSIVVLTYQGDQSFTVWKYHAFIFDRSFIHESKNKEEEKKIC